MSYDSVGVLNAFSERHGITFPLLSDEGSQVIDELGLRNLHVAEQQAHFGKPVAAKHEGMPYPGTFVIDKAGVLISKKFEQSHRIRPSGASLLAELGDREHVVPQLSDEFDSHGVRVAGWLGTRRYRPLQILPLQLTIDLPKGLHVYGDPAPPGFTALDVSIQGDGIVSLVDEPPLPEPRPFRMEGLDESFFVHEGRMELQIPFAIDRGRRDEPVEVAVTFQACTYDVCHPPTTGILRFALVEAAQ